MRVGFGTGKGLSLRCQAVLVHDVLDLRRLESHVPAPRAEAAFGVHALHPRVERRALRSVLLRVLAFDLQQGPAAREPNEEVWDEAPPRAVCAEDMVFHRDDRSWIQPFIAKNRHYRIEPHTHELRTAEGTLLISTQRVIARSATGANYNDTQSPRGLALSHKS